MRCLERAAVQETQREGAKAPQGPRPLSETAEGLGKATHLCGSRCHRDHLAVEPSDARICPSAHSREPRATHASAKPPGCQLKPRVRGQDAHPKPLPHIKRPRSQEMFAALMTHALLYKKLLKQELPCVRLPGGLVALSVAPSPQRAPCSRPPPSSPPLSPGQSGPGGSLAVLLGRDSLGGLTLMAKSSIIRHVTPKFRPPVAFPPPPPGPRLILSYLWDTCSEVASQTSRSRQARGHPAHSSFTAVPGLGHPRTLSSLPPHPAARPAPHHPPLPSTGHRHERDLKTQFRFYWRPA